MRDDSNIRNNDVFNEFVLVRDKNFLVSFLITVVPFLMFWKIGVVRSRPDRFWSGHIVCGNELRAGAEEWDDRSPTI